MTTGERAAGLSAAIRSALQTSVQEKIFPGAVAALISRDDELCVPFGFETYDPAARPVTVQSVFDVASLTKIVATATAVMQLVERNRLSLHDRACDFLPPLRRTGKDSITILHLLAHMAGFPGGEPLRCCRSRDEIFDTIFSMDLVYPPGSDRIYDDLGYIILGAIVECVTGLALDAYCAREIFAPLAMTETMFVPSPALRERIVPTEVDPERGGLLRGVVHDGTAHRLGGVAGHAGLFMRVRDLGRFARTMMGDDDSGRAGVLSSASLQLMWSRHWRDSEGEYGLGWDRLRPCYMNGLEDDAVGHTGFTGVSLVISRSRDLAIILLSNRVHPVRADRSLIHLARCRLVEAAMRW